MFEKTAKTITDKLLAEDIVLHEDKEIYLFGVQQGLNLILNLATMIAIGLVFGAVWELVVYTVFYGALRRFAGGYHARTQMNCYVLSAILLATIAMLINFVEIQPIFLVWIALFTCTNIILLSPVADANKPLDKIEEKVYKRRAIIISIIQLGTVLLGVYFDIVAIARIVTLALATVHLMILAGLLRARSNSFC